MCLHCHSPADWRLRLSRRSFSAGALAAIAPGCFPLAHDELVEPRMRLIVPAKAPRTVALTLDACSGGVDMRIIGTLLALSIPATLFVTALWLRANTHILGLLHTRSDLFTLENHGELHLPAVLGTRHVYGLPVAGTLDAIRQEVKRGSEAVVAAGAPPPGWYRTATGLYSPAAIEVIDAKIAGYSLVADEGASLPAAAVARRIGTAVSGDIIIAHVNHPHRSSGAGVAAGIAALHRTGTVFVGLDTHPATPLTCRPHAVTPRIV
ncbi:MAG: polysaccharide deacetylase family protein [Rhodopila sp.]